MQWVTQVLFWRQLPVIVVTVVKHREVNRNKALPVGGFAQWQWEITVRNTTAILRIPKMRVSYKIVIQYNLLTPFVHNCASWIRLSLLSSDKTKNSLLHYQGLLGSLRSAESTKYRGKMAQNLFSACKIKSFISCKIKLVQCQQDRFISVPAT